MNKAKIINFLEQIIPTYSFDVRYIKETDYSPAYVDENNIIWIDKNLFYSYSNISQKCILMHEAGHIVIGFLKNKTNTEYCAHMWAIKEAKKKGWNDLHKELENIITGWSTKLKWNDDKGIWRAYIQAGKKFLRRKK